MRRRRDTATSSRGEAAQAANGKRFDGPALKRKSIPSRETERYDVCLQTLPEQEKAHVPKQYVSLMSSCECDSRVDLKGGFPLPADTLESC